MNKRQALKHFLQRREWFKDDASNLRHAEHRRRIAQRAVKAQTVAIKCIEKTIEDRT